MRIAVIPGSTRPRRHSPAVAAWVLDVARQVDAPVELLDLSDYNLPLLDEPVPAALSDDYVHDRTRRWGEAVDQFDAFVFVTPEYNHSLPAALKNALDLVYREWNDKVAGVVSYGLHGGVRATEHLRMICAELQIATVRTQVALSLFDDFEELDRFTPRAHHEATLVRLLDEVITWGSALEDVRRRNRRTGGGDEKVVVVGRAPWKLREAVRVLDEAGYAATGALDRTQALGAVEANDRLFALVLSGAVGPELERELRVVAEPRGAAIVRTAIGHADPAGHFVHQVLPRLDQLRKRASA